MVDWKRNSSGRAVEIVSVTEDHKFTLNDSALESILHRRDVIDKKVAVVSVAGAFRRGKSFILNFFLRYLKSGSQKENWLENESIGKKKLDGFSWRGGYERDTSGILLWSEPFFVKTWSGNEIVVLLMDTQGAFDSESTVKDCATVFALSTMISSMQIYNISGNLQENDLQYLQYFTEYGLLALEHTDTWAKPFQALTFLIRDWSFPYDAPYGFEGGKIVLDRRLTISEKQHPELQQLRQQIRKCFAKINCFLMPYPGSKVATTQHFNGQLSDISDEFQDQLEQLVPGLLSAERLMPKEINGRTITGRELMEYFRVYVEIFRSDKLPEPKSAFAATAQANYLAAVASALAEYERGMERDFDAGLFAMVGLAFSIRKFDECHRQNKQKARVMYHVTPKMGGKDERLTRKYSEMLEVKIEESKRKYANRNQKTKRVFEIGAGIAGVGLAAAAGFMATYVLGPAAVFGVVMRVLK